MSAWPRTRRRKIVFSVWGETPRGVPLHFVSAEWDTSGPPHEVLSCVVSVQDSLVTEVVRIPYLSVTSFLTSYDPRRLPSPTPPVRYERGGPCSNTRDRRAVADPVTTLGSVWKILGRPTRHLCLTPHCLRSSGHQVHLLRTDRTSDDVPTSVRVRVVTAPGGTCVVDTSIAYREEFYCPFPDCD